jgi:hypothetical protein
MLQDDRESDVDLLDFRNQIEEFFLKILKILRLMVKKWCV